MAEGAAWAEHGASMVGAPSGTLKAAATAEAPGVRVSPKLGDAIVWYNFDADGQLDPRAVHSALPVVPGKEKWVANFWCTITPNELLAMAT